MNVSDAINTCMIHAPAMAKLCNGVWTKGTLDRMQYPIVDDNDDGVNDSNGDDGRSNCGMISISMCCRADNETDYVPPLVCRRCAVKCGSCNGTWLCYHEWRHDDAYDRHGHFTCLQCDTPCTYT